jgi:hypothetical protein
MMNEVDRYRTALDSDILNLVDAVRNIVASADPHLTEGIKWNAPSFAIKGEDRITLGLERKGGIRVVFHRGAKPQPLHGFRFDDVDALAEWPAPDRGVVKFRDRADLERRAKEFGDLCVRWIAATNP